MTQQNPSKTWSLQKTHTHRNTHSHIYMQGPSGYWEGKKKKHIAPMLMILQFTLSILIILYTVVNMSNQPLNDFRLILQRGISNKCKKKKETETISMTDGPKPVITLAGTEQFYSLARCHAIFLNYGNCTPHSNHVVFPCRILSSYSKLLILREWENNWGCCDDSGSYWLFKNNSLLWWV